nr:MULTISPECIES: NAD(P)-binding domain-containing protein [unclassified Paraburkholderia]
MARNLARAGHEVKAWNRSGGSVEGVTMVASPIEAVQGECRAHNAVRRRRNPLDAHHVGRARTPRRGGEGRTQCAHGRRP